MESIERCHLEENLAGPTISPVRLHVLASNGCSCVLRKDDRWELIRGLESIFTLSLQEAHCGVDGRMKRAFAAAA
jgi:hypothetical protein